MIKEVLEALNDEQRRQLMHAFEHKFEQFIELKYDRFIGVNVSKISHLEVLESAGDWAFGRIRR